MEVCAVVVENYGDGLKGREQWWQMVCYIVNCDIAVKLLRALYVVTGSAVGWFVECCID
jgi:hypothetical protein